MVGMMRCRFYHFEVLLLVGSGCFCIIRVRGCWRCDWSEKVFNFVRLVNYFLSLGMKVGWFLVKRMESNG